MNRILSTPLFFIRSFVVFSMALSLTFVAAGAVSSAKVTGLFHSLSSLPDRFTTAQLVDVMGWENPYISQNVSKKIDFPLPSIALRFALNLNPNNLESLLNEELPYLSAIDINSLLQEDSHLVYQSAPAFGVITKNKNSDSAQSQSPDADPGSQWSSALKETGSYYVVRQHMLWHHVKGGTFVYGAAPDFLKPGKTYYSPDGHTYYTSDGKKAGIDYQYFEILPLNTKTSYTADQLNQYIQSHIPKRYASKMGGPGPLAKLGSAFIKAQNQYGVNALYLLAHAIHESAWGSSEIAQNKHNLFGFGAVDSDPYNGAKNFSTYQDCINYVAKYVDNQYQDPFGAYYYGDMLGNKQTGMNVKYASDPYWGQEIAGLMYQIDKALGGKDFGKFDSGHYSLAVSTVNGKLNVRTLPSFSNKDIQYHFRSSGDSMIVLGKVHKSYGIWYEIYSDASNFLDWKKAYVYHKGQFGILSKIVKVAGMR